MHRFFVAPEKVVDDQAWLDEEESRHLTKVLRLEAGASVIVFDGVGREYCGVIGKVTMREVQLTGLTRTEAIREAPVAVTLVQGVAKGEKMDWIVQKATELGVMRIIPVLTERSVVRIDPTKGAERSDRWRKIAREAVKQSRRTVVPQIEPPCSWSAAMLAWPETVPMLVPWEEHQGAGLGSVLRRSTVPPAQLGLAIGPEGGLTAGEVALAMQQGATPVGLGPRILRTETAGLAALAVIMSELGDWG